MTISEIRSTSPSLCAVADSCTIHLDRRLTRGETLERAVAEVEALESVRRAGATVTVLDYARAVVHRPDVPDEEVLSDVGAGGGRTRRCARGGRGRRAGARPGAGGRQVGVLDQRHRDVRDVRHPDVGLRPGQRDSRAHARRPVPGRAPDARGAVLRGVPRSCSSRPCRVPARRGGAGRLDIRDDRGTARRCSPRSTSDFHNGDFLLTWEHRDPTIRAVLLAAEILEDLARAGISARVFDSGLGISIFRDKSTRTRYAFRAGCNLLGLMTEELDEAHLADRPRRDGARDRDDDRFLTEVIGIRDDMFLGEGHKYMREVARGARGEPPRRAC